MKRLRAAVWSRYEDREGQSAVRRREHEENVLRFAGSTMRFESFRIGEKPDTGYPLFIALHGGGSAPARVNDRGWEHMKRYYRDSVDRGVYVATRGMTDSWNMHSQAPACVMYDRIIENMILFEGVDPNRVYLLGFSAGGDGVYQVAPRMADRFAAANMSAGHPNGVSPVNLYHVPFLLQMGEQDRAFNRNTEVVRYAARLDRLRGEYPDGYLHSLFLHLDKPHNFRDNHPEGARQSVLSHPFAWSEFGDRTHHERDANAVHWLVRHHRDPHPARLRWDLSTTADRSGSVPDGDAFWETNGRNRSFYWIDRGDDPASGDVREISVALIEGENSIRVERAGDYLKLLIRDDMLDAGQPVVVKVGDRSFSVRITGSIRNMAATLLDRGDPEFMFESAIALRKKDGEWWIAE